MDDGQLRILLVENDQGARQSLRLALKNRGFDVDAVESGWAVLQRLEEWKLNRRVRSIRPGMTLRVQAPAPFWLRWTQDEWHQIKDTLSTPTALGITFVDIPVPPDQRAPIRFTFFWSDTENWEGRDYTVEIRP